MLIFDGVLLVSLSVLLFAGGLVASQGPRAPLWLTEGWGGTVLTLAALALLVWGVLALGEFALNSANYKFTLEEAVLIAADLIISVFVWKHLQVGRRLRAYWTVQPAAETIEPSSPERPITPKPSSPTKRAA